jgi:uncharacterized membrane protein
MENERDIGSGIVKGIVITFLGVLGLTFLGGVKTASSSTAYATMTSGQPVDLVFAGIVMVGVLTSVVYYFAHE